MNKVCTGVISLGLLLGVLGAHALDIPGYSPDEMRIYKEVDDVELTLDIFHPPGHQGSDRRPAIVFFFGGGWNGGHPSQFHPHCEYLASRGMVAMTAQYRVKSRNGTTPRECVSDGKSAVRWIRQHATDLGIDPNRIAAGGGSAGGHVAAASALCDGFDEVAEDVTISARPDALVLFNPVFDNSPDGYGHGRVKDYWQAISPMHNIGETAPPTFIVLGSEDRLIPVSTAERYKAKMESLGERCDLHVYEGQKHGFFNKPRSERYYRETAIEMDRFLISIGYLEREPTMQPLDASG